MRRRRMPWKETGPFEERRRFVETCRDSDESFSAICERFGISRQKGYKWLARVEVGGLEALADRSRRPHSNSRAVPGEGVGYELTATCSERGLRCKAKRFRWPQLRLVRRLQRPVPRRSAL